MSTDTEICKYLGEEVVQLITFLKCNNKVQLDYKLIGNHHGTTLVLRFTEPATAMHENTSLPSPSHKSPAARKRDYRRLVNMKNIGNQTDIDTMPLGNIVPRGSDSVCSKSYEYKQTMTDNTLNQQAVDTHETMDIMHEKELMTTVSNSQIGMQCDEEMDKPDRSRMKCRKLRNVKLDELYIDKQGAERNLIGITDDYIIKILCSKHAACTFDETNSEFHNLAALVKSWDPADINEHRYEASLLHSVLQKQLPERTNKWFYVSGIREERT